MRAIWSLPVISFLLAGISLAWPAMADTYQYDAYGRLMSVTYSDGSSITYQYDAAGNRTVLTQASAP